MFRDRFYIFLVMIFVMLGGCEAEEDMELGVTKLRTKTPIPNTFGLHLLNKLVDRVWVTEFNGGKVTDFSIFRKNKDFCKGRISTINNEEVDFALSDFQKAEELFIWPYLCRPVRLIYDHVTRDTRSETFIEIEMVDFSGVDRVLPEVFDILTKNRLGDYKMSDQKYDAIKEKIKLSATVLRTTNSSKLEEWSWEDVPEEQNIGDLEYDTVMKNRVLMLSWDGEVHSKRAGYVTYKLKVPENFFQGW